MRWLKWLFVLDSWLALRGRFFLRNDNVWPIDSFSCVEFTLRLDTLREGFILNFALVVESFFFSKLSRTVIIIFHVWDFSTEWGTITSLAFFGWVGQKVSWLNDYGTFLITVLFLNVSSLIHVIKSSLDWLLDLLGRGEVLIMTSLQVSILGSGSSQHICSSVLEGIADSNITIFLRVLEVNIVTLSFLRLGSSEVSGSSLNIAILVEVCLLFLNVSGITNGSWNWLRE